MHRRELIGDIQIAFDDQGVGAAVLMLHPFPFDGRAWTANANALVTAGLRVVVPDYPGFGDSPAPPRALSIEDLAALMARLIDRLSIDAVVPVGLSMGGYVALAFAKKFPSRLRALVLADTRAAADGPVARQGRADALATIQKKGVDAYLDQSLPRLLAPAPSTDLLARVRDLSEKREDTLTAGIAALRDRPDRTSELPAIACPTLVLVGGRDQITPPDEMRTIAAAIPGAAFETIAEAGHLSNLEAPAAFNRALIDFLRKISGPDMKDMPNTHRTKEQTP